MKNYFKFNSDILYYKKKVVQFYLLLKKILMVKINEILHTLNIGEHLRINIRSIRTL